MDLEALLQSRGDENPSGEDLVYDLAFMTLELAAQPGEERQAGDKIIAAEDPDFKEVTEAALAVLEQSHDLRAGVFLSMSELRLRGFSGFADGTAYLRGCLENYWDTCHPQLDAEDDNDPTQRVNVILSLAAPDTILRGIRITPLTDSRTFGRISLRDIAVAATSVSPTVTAFLEVPRDESWSTSIPAMVAAIAGEAASLARPIGAKLRCGGLDAGAFPSSAQIARFLISGEAAPGSTVRVDVGDRGLSIEPVAAPVDAGEPSP